MKIGIDLSVLQGGSALRGMGRAAVQCVEALLAFDAENEYLLLHQPTTDLSSSLKSLRTTANARLVALNFPAAGLFDSHRHYSIEGERRYTYALEHFAREQQLDILHLPCFDENAYYYTPRSWTACKLVLTIHDLIPYKLPDQYLNDEATRDNYSRAIEMIRSADSLIAVSETTRDDLIQMLDIDPNRIFVAPTYCSPIFAPLSPFHKTTVKDDLPTLGIDSRYIFTVSGFGYGKNLANLLRAFAALPDALSDVQLVISAMVEQERVPPEILSLVRTLGIEKRVVWTGILDDAQIVRLYQHAAVYTHLSYVEGFGIPILEAMQSGTPVVVSNNGAPLEVVGDAGLTAPPDAPSQIAEVIASVLLDPERYWDMAYRGLRRAAAFSEMRLAEGTKAAYRAALSLSQHTSPLRLAVWSPLPPQQSGISDYSRSLIDALSQQASVVVYTHPEADRAGLGSLPTATYDERRRPDIDVNIYQMGNNVEFHEQIYRELQREPGIVVLHDLSLFGFYSFLYWHRGDHRRMIEEVNYSHGEAEAQYTAQYETGERSVDLTRLHMLRRIVTLSLGVIVHSQDAAVFLQREFPNTLVFHIPQGTTISEAGASQGNSLRQQLGLDDSAVVVGVFGGVTSQKRIDVVVKAFAHVLKTNPRLHLLIVGYDQSDYAKTLRRDIQKLGIGSAVHWIGTIADMKTFQHYMESVDVVVNLRVPSIGETSATFMLAIGAGKPVITTDLPQYQDYPDAFCWKVSADEHEFRTLKRLLEFAASENLALYGEAARTFARQHAQWTTVAAKYIRAAQSIKARQSRTPPLFDSYGVTIIGDLHGDFGISEACRGIAQALRKAAIPLSYTEVIFDTSSRLTTFDAPPSGNQPINLWYLNPPQLYQALETLGSGVADNRYNIGYWFYELPDLPPDWLDAFALLDEVWVATEFVRSAIQKVSPIPVHIVPVPIHVEPDTIIGRGVVPQWDQGRYTFLYSFSVLASSARKNPFGVIEAFRKAFGDLSPQQAPLLILKAQFLDDYPRLREALLQAARGLPMLLITKNLNRAEMNALLANCDCYVSLHRSEGFGLAMAEAMALGKPVIATAWSGNVDFMQETTSYLVPYRLGDIDLHQHRYQESHAALYRPQSSRWAEPDIVVAAEMMRQVFDDPREAVERGLCAAAFMREHYSPDAVASIIKKRLGSIDSSVIRNRLTNLYGAVTPLHDAASLSRHSDVHAGTLTSMGIDMKQLTERQRSVDQQFRVWDRVRLLDTDTPLSRALRRIPVVGYIYRTLVRLLTIGRLQAAQMVLFQQMLSHEHELLNTIEQLARRVEEDFHRLNGVQEQTNTVQHQMNVADQTLSTLQHQTYSFQPWMNKIEAQQQQRDASITDLEHLHQVLDSDLKLLASEVQSSAEELIGKLESHHLEFRMQLNSEHERLSQFMAKQQVEAERVDSDVSARLRQTDGQLRATLSQVRYLRRLIALDLKPAEPPQPLLSPDELVTLLHQLEAWHPNFQTAERDITVYAGSTRADRWTNLAVTHLGGLYRVSEPEVWYCADLQYPTETQLQHEAQVLHAALTKVRSGGWTVYIQVLRESETLEWHVPLPEGIQISATHHVRVGHEQVGIHVLQRNVHLVSDMG